MLPIRTVRDAEFLRGLVAEIAGCEITLPQAQQIISRQDQLLNEMYCSTGMPIRQSFPSAYQLSHCVELPCTKVSIDQQLSFVDNLALQTLRNALSLDNDHGGITVVSGRTGSGKTSMANALVWDRTADLQGAALVFSGDTPFELMEKSADAEQWVLFTRGEIMDSREVRDLIKLASKGVKVIVELYANSAPHAVDQFWEGVGRCEVAGKDVKKLIKNQALAFLHVNLTSPNLNSQA